ncbi:E7 [Leptonychotes weddellii papillomavirus 4]|uniref:Protein E7 n=1 Tax=Leptonychotes weddellii papillomavirus 4 TaxID=2077305 RepID=A0A2I8B2Q7_9PAPI|nr:E7 [Leptonychotes weddellii papillomavirus 4]AUT11924.1 E7 [Leptonychotes weddellii papillomavirus 4]
MIGKEPTLRDIVLEETPCPADLYCNERIEEAEQNISEGNHDAFKVLVTCGHCDRPVRLVILASRDQVRVLHRLLLEGLCFVCPYCCRERDYN